MEHIKIFDMSQTSSQGEQVESPAIMVHKRISIDSNPPKPKKELTEKQIKAKEKKHRQRIENLKLKILEQDEKVNGMKDGPMRNKSKLKLKRMEKELESLEGE